MHASTLDALFEALIVSPLADRMRVFGSVARGSTIPGDLDVFIDLMDPPFEGRWTQGRAPTVEETKELGRIIRLASKHYGDFDPFVRVHRGVNVRNKWAEDWVRAKEAERFWETVKREGVPLRIAFAAWQEAKQRGVSLS